MAQSFPGRLLLWGLLWLSLGSTSPASALPDTAEQARAEILFDEGKRLLEEKRYEEACPKLEESLKIEEAGGTLAALALCHQAQGRSATAWAEFRALLALAHRTNHLARKALAEEALRDLEPTLIWLQIEVSPASASRPDLEVSLDGRPLGRASWGLSLPLDPGPHTLKVEAPGYKPWSHVFQVGPAPERRTIAVPALELLPASPSSVVPPITVSPAASPESPLPPVASPSPGWTPSLIAGGFGVVSLVVGGYFGASALRLQQDANRICPERACQDDAAIRQSQSAVRNAWIANVGVGVGLAGLAVAYLLRPPPRNTAAREPLGVGGTFTPGGGKLVVQGAF